ncbi:MAG: flagellar biosynthesis protein FlgJ [Clostridiaceae bacterium]|nr:flagellar biosynthesis protein FlgJ [Clostridiaceae bacterium]
MTVNGLGYINPLDTISSSKAKIDETSFESVLKKAYDENDKKKLKEACDQFEALMLQMLFKQMKATVPEGGLIEKSNARSIFEDMLDETLMQQASNRGVGLSDMMYKHLSSKLDRMYNTQSGEITETENTNNFDGETDGVDPVEE